MELKENQYKESEIGIIPYDWEVTSLGDITIKVGSGITPTGGEKVYKLEGRIFLRSQNIGNGKLFLQDVAYIDDEIHNTFTSSEIHEKDVFLNITGASIGRSAVANSVVVHGNVNQHVCIIRVNQASLDPYYLNYFLSSQNGQKQINNYQAGGNRQGLNFEQIKSFQIPLPTKPEQIAIATALSDTDALIENLEKLLVKKRNIKQCIMHKLLSPKKYWETRKIIDIVSTPVTDGPHETPRFLKEGIPFLSVNNLVNNRIDFNELRFISLEDNQLYSKKCKPQKNDILLGKAASVGKVAILDSDLEINIWSPIALIRPR
ncbi:MAG: restriction endonuclease subunit S, partial [Bacteroidales bacterium]|nr:restriction endonuclease subunit S [Bacteroidales bacterium]